MPSFERFIHINPIVHGVSEVALVHGGGKFTPSFFSFNVYAKGWNISPVLFLYLEICRFLSFQNEQTSGT